MAVTDQVKAAMAETKKRVVAEVQERAAAAALAAEATTAAAAVTGLGPAASLDDPSGNRDKEVDAEAAGCASGGPPANTSTSTSKYQQATTADAAAKCG